MLDQHRIFYSSWYIAPSYFLKITGSAHSAIRATVIHSAINAQLRWATLPDNTNRFAWSLAIEDVMYFLKWLERKTIKHQKKYKTEFRYDSNYQILELTKTSGGGKSCRHFTPTLFLAHEKSETHLPEVTNQVSNKTGCTNRQRPTEAFDEKSRAKRRLHPPSQAKTPEWVHHCLGKGNLNTSLWFLGTGIRVLEHFQSHCDKQRILDHYPLGSHHPSFLHPPAFCF